MSTVKTTRSRQTTVYAVEIPSATKPGRSKLWSITVRQPTHGLFAARKTEGRCNWLRNGSVNSTSPAMNPRELPADILAALLAAMPPAHQTMVAEDATPSNGVKVKHGKYKQYADAAFREAVRDGV